MVKGILAAVAIALLLSTAVYAASDGSGGFPGGGFNPFGNGPIQQIGGIVAALGGALLTGAFAYNPGIFSVGGSSNGGGGSNGGRNEGDSQR